MAFVSQQIRIITTKRKDGQQLPRLNIYVQKKTGFSLVTINGKQYNYNFHKAFSNPDEIDFEEIANYEKSFNKKVIIVRKKRK